MSSIYCLKDPETGRVEYIGQTVHPLEDRLKAHIAESQTAESKRAIWIRSLVYNGKLPIMELVESCDDLDLNTREQYWIDHHQKQNPELKNGCAAPGEKNGSMRSKKVSFTLDSDYIDLLKQLSEVMYSSQTLTLQKAIDLLASSIGLPTVAPLEPAGRAGRKTKDSAH